MASDIDMCSNALQLIGDSPISSFIAPGTGAQVAGSLYPETYKSVLATYPWAFSLKEQYLSRLSQSPDGETNYKYAFQTPPDLIRVWKVMTWNKYSIVGPYIYSNQTTLLCRYIYEVEESALPATLVKAIEYKLAAEFAVPVTEDEKKAQFYERKYLMQLSVAQTIDSQNQPQKPIVDSPFIDVRFSGGTYAYWG
jgi:hypothetical protein